MRKKINIKSKLAAVLAAAMVISVAAPGIPAYAVDYGQDVVIKFDPMSGPGMKYTSYNVLSGVSDGSALENGVFVAKGQAGHPLKDSPYFTGAPMESFTSGERPKLPEFNVNWDGYTFDGWYNEAGNKLRNLAYPFPYETETIYHAVWKGKDTTPYKFTVEHCRNLDNGQGWPEEYSDQTKIRRFYESSWTTDQMASNPVSGTYRRDIPGYQFSSVLIRNNKPRKYGEESGKGSMDGGAAVDGQTHKIKGNMPNDNLTVAYLYKPDPAKKFPVTVRYVNEGGDGGQIRTPDVLTRQAEEEYTVTPPAFDAYLLSSVELTQGESTDLDGSGIISAGDAGYKEDPSTHRITGHMPNQAITFTCKYKPNPDFHTILRVKRLDSHGNPLQAEEVRQDVTPGQPITVDAVKMPGYSYPPRPSWDDSLSNVVLDQNEQKLTLTPGMAGGTVTIVYNEDTTDTDFWGKVDFYHGQNGGFDGVNDSKYVKKSDNETLAQVTDGVLPAAGPHYRFEGWYLANSAGTDKTGSILKDDTVINSSMKLFANFVEQEGDWFDLTFTSGAHGLISGDKKLHTVTGTRWTDLTLPDPHPDTAYTFAGWFDEAGNKVQPTQTIIADQTYEARFVPMHLSDDGVLAMPDARGSVSPATGSGTVSVAGANENRRYALTDSGNRVIGTEPGSQLKNGGFTGLNPCESYYAYELELAANPKAGEILPEVLDPGTFSPPTLVTVPALADSGYSAHDHNYRVENDENGTKKVVVSPANPDTLYAILDMDGELAFAPDNAADGWVAPDGSPLSAVFGGLAVNQPYVVVAKHQGESGAPADKMLSGSQVAVTGDSREEPEYTFELTNGGFITDITRDGSEVPFDDPGHAVVRAGDVIGFDTDPKDSAGQPFKRWNALLGDLPLAEKTRRNPQITMPKGNLVVQAEYHYPDSATPGNATAAIDYTPKGGSVALELSSDARSQILEKLTDNDSDRSAMAAKVDVLYTVKFDKRIPRASVSDAVKAQVNDDAVKVPWALTSTLERQVGGSNKDVPDGIIMPDIHVYSELDRSIRGYMGYQLWEVSEQDGELTCLQVEMTPEPGDGEAGFTGVVSFDGKVESTYVLTYLKSCLVTVIDDKKSATYKIKVKSGTALGDSDEYNQLSFDDYTDPKTGIVWEYKGLGRTAGSSDEYDVASPVTGNMTLHVIYRQEDDSEWQAAKKKLTDEISIARQLMSNTTVSDENKETLSAAIDEALKVANRQYRPTVDELTAAYDTLKTLVDFISSGGDNPDGGGDNPDGGGGNSGGGGGSGGGSHRSGASGHSAGPSFSFNGYPTFSSGTDGRWEAAGADNSKWAFVLKSGRKAENEWANVKYNDARETCTYHFNAQGLMDSGWYMDGQGKWYYLDETPGANLGRLTVGWHLDSQAQKWYYLNQFTGAMAVGWQKIGQDWYYLSPVTVAGQPTGSLYTNGMTPDGYPVDENGRWLRAVP